MTRSPYNRYELAASRLATAKLHAERFPGFGDPAARVEAATVAMRAAWAAYVESQQAPR